MLSLKAFLRDYLQYNFSLDEIVERYVEWVVATRYMILSRWNTRLLKNDVFAVKCAKRGNDVYSSRVHNRFKGLSSSAEKLVFFNPKDRGIKKTRALWVTLTYDVKLCSFAEAWRNIGTEFNRFTAYVRKEFGKVSVCRVWESFENGYPHIHCILLFEEYEFSVFRDSKGQFRVYEKDVLAEGWHSNIDVKAMNSLAGGFSYLKKYLLKSIDFEKANSKTDSKTLKTLALCWAFRKRAFSVSGEFRQMLSILIEVLKNSKLRLRQVTLSGEIIEENRFYVLGFVSSTVLKLKRNVWFFKLELEQIRAVEKDLRERSIGF